MSETRTGTHVWVGFAGTAVAVLLALFALVAALDGEWDVAFVDAALAGMLVGYALTR